MQHGQRLNKAVPTRFANEGICTNTKFEDESSRLYDPGVVAGPWGLELGLQFAVDNDKLPDKLARYDVVHGIALTIHHVDLKTFAGPAPPCIDEVANYQAQHFKASGACKNGRKQMPRERAIDAAVNSTETVPTPGALRETSEMSWRMLLLGGGAFWINSTADSAHNGEVVNE